VKERLHISSSHRSSRISVNVACKERTKEGNQERKKMKKYKAYFICHFNGLCPQNIAVSSLFNAPFSGLGRDVVKLKKMGTTR
jgi:hypothetical protein